MVFADNSIQERARALGITEEIPAYFADLLISEQRTASKVQSIDYESCYTRGLWDIKPENDNLYPNKDSYAPFLELV